MDRGTPVAVVAVPGVGVALAHADAGWAWPAQASAVLAEVESALAPRWVWWSAHGSGTPLTGPPDRPRQGHRDRCDRCERPRRRC
ncbi:hypothetical protein FrEUN1fDRAFT_2718, partial [Parafrankia sp. EUN1f]